MDTLHNKDRFTKNLLAWYDQHARILPWRENTESYRIWVSEIMLQQTRVEAVKPYFERFIHALPTLQDLANADEDELKKLWEGLGYYNRIKNMKKCAQICMKEYGGQLPSSYEQLLSLPGIGSYTAGAIASIAYKQRVPAVDGNVLRVFSRVLVSEDDILKEKTKRKFQDIIIEYIPKDRSDAFNQALMEIGALICVPNASPKCTICPLAQDCIGFKTKQAEKLPIKTKKKARKIENKTIIIVVANHKVFIQKRPKEGVLSDLYEFITLNHHMTKNEVECKIGKSNIKKIMRLQDTKHIFTHIEWHMRGYLIELKNITEEGLWVSEEDLNNTYAIPTAFKKYKEALEIWWKAIEN